MKANSSLRPAPRRTAALLATAMLAATMSAANAQADAVVTTSQDISTFVTGNGSLYTLDEEGGILHEVIQNLTTGGWSDNSTGIHVSPGLTSWYDAARNATYVLVEEGASTYQTGTLHEVIQNMGTGGWSDNSTGIAVSGQLASFVTGTNDLLYTMADENGTLGVP